MTNEQLTPQALDEIQDMLGLALMTPDVATNDLVDMLDQLCRELRAARQAIARLEALPPRITGSVIRPVYPVHLNDDYEGD